MSQANTVKEFLIATEWILEHLDWVQVAWFRDSKGESFFAIDPQERLQRARACCLSGAMMLVNATTGLQGESERHFLNTIGEATIVFNDWPGRTKKQVLKAVRKAIESAP